MEAPECIMPGFKLDACLTLGVDEPEIVAFEDCHGLEFRVILNQGGDYQFLWMNSQDLTNTEIEHGIWTMTIYDEGIRDYKLTSSSNNTRTVRVDESFECVQIF